MTLDRLSGGRLVLGVGLGPDTTGEFDPAPWFEAGATWCLTGFSNQPQLGAVRDAIAAGPSQG